MTITKPMELRADLKKYCDMAFNGEPVYVVRKNNENVVIVSEEEFREWQEWQKEKRNAAYLEMLDRSLRQLEHGEVVVKTMEELEAMANE